MILKHRRSKTEASVASVMLVVLAVGQVVSGALSGLFGGAFTTADRPGEPPIVPAGYTFSIWGLIEAFSVAFAIWAFFARRTNSGADRELIDRLTRPMLVVFAGFSVWLAAAELEPTWSTLAVFVIMFLALLRALSELRRGQARLADWSRLGRVLTYGTAGVYAGWSSIAIWLNVTTALAGSGAPITGAAGILGQFAILTNGHSRSAAGMDEWVAAVRGRRVLGHHRCRVRCRRGRPTGAGYRCCNRLPHCRGNHRRPADGQDSTDRPPDLRERQPHGVPRGRTVTRWVMR
jgi:hypothetical protein